MSEILVIAPHPDDETLGCGGTLLRHKAEGAGIHWCLITEASLEAGYSEAEVAQREQEILAVARSYGFASVHRLAFPTTMLDTVPMRDIIGKLTRVMQEVAPREVYLPYRGDIHTDHRRVFDAAAACCKWFRHPSIRRVLAYETLSETEFGLNPDDKGFKPNVFIDISPFLEQKISIMKLFSHEMGEHPFPRSEDNLRALTRHRGAMAGTAAAEAFMLLKEIR